MTKEEIDAIICIIGFLVFIGIAGFLFNVIMLEEPPVFGGRP